MIARWMGAAPRQRGVQIEAAEPRRVENVFGQKEPVGDDDGRIRTQLRERLPGRHTFQRFGRAQFKSMRRREP